MMQGARATSSAKTTVRRADDQRSAIMVRQLEGVSTGLERPSQGVMSRQSLAFALLRQLESMGPWRTWAAWPLLIGNSTNPRTTRHDSQRSGRDAGISWGVLLSLYTRPHAKPDTKSWAERPVQMENHPVLDCPR